MDLKAQQVLGEAAAILAVSFMSTFFLALGNKTHQILVERGRQKDCCKGKAIDKESVRPVLPPKQAICLDIPLSYLDIYSSPFHSPRVCAQRGKKG